MQHYNPEDIEKKSFEIITRELGDVQIDEIQAPIIKRVIHTTADFEYLSNLCFSERAVENALSALHNGADIVTDTMMAYSGINKTVLAKGGGTAHCFMADKDVAEEAKEKNTTRASVSMGKAALLRKDLIFAVGNAPTALIKLEEMIRSGTLRPALVIGVPVGFVNVVESKELIMKTDVPFIVARGRKGGSAVAASIVNALLYMAFPRNL
jgi:precorrin-8X/cobalt-precorrin-8 methylmutase